MPVMSMKLAHESPAPTQDPLGWQLVPPGQLAQRFPSLPQSVWSVPA